MCELRGIGCSSACEWSEAANSLSGGQQVYDFIENLKALNNPNTALCQNNPRRTLHWTLLRPTSKPQNNPRKKWASKVLAGDIAAATKALAAVTPNSVQGSIRIPIHFVEVLALLPVVTTTCMPQWHGLSQVAVKGCPNSSASAGEVCIRRR